MIVASSYPEKYYSVLWIYKLRIKMLWKFPASQYFCLNTNVDILDIKKYSASYLHVLVAPFWTVLIIKNLYNCKLHGSSSLFSAQDSFFFQYFLYSSFSLHLLHELSASFFYYRTLFTLSIKIHEKPTLLTFSDASKLRWLLSLNC